MNKEIQKDWYEELVKDCQVIITETVFNSRWALVEGYHQLGERIKKDSNKEPITKLLQDLAVSMGKSERTLWYSVQFVTKYPTLDKVPEGKNISWNKLTTQYLPEPQKLPTPELPRGKFNVVYADPPWDIDSMVLEKWESPLSDKYPTMSLEELKALDIQSLENENCVCFMWTTHTKLPDALELLEKWGFKYHCLLTWDKGNGWSISGFHRKTEFVVFGYKGILSEVVKQKGEYIPTVFYEKKTTHSTKPEIMYKFIEDRTIGKKIELFARIKRKGWEVWGNQI